jgi:hypothetical protein
MQSLPGLHETEKLSLDQSLALATSPSYPVMAGRAAQAALVQFTSACVPLYHPLQNGSVVGPLIPEKRLCVEKAQTTAQPRQRVQPGQWVSLSQTPWW